MIFFHMLMKKLMPRSLTYYARPIGETDADIGIRIEVTTEARAWLAKTGYEPQ